MRKTKENWDDYDAADIVQSEENIEIFGDLCGEKESPQEDEDSIEEEEICIGC